MCPKSLWKQSKVICNRNNFHSPELVPIVEINSLHPNMRCVVARYGEVHRQAIYSDADGFTQHNGEAVCVRKIASKPGRTAQPL